MYNSFTFLGSEEILNLILNYAFTKISLINSINFNVTKEHFIFFLFFYIFLNVCQHLPAKEPIFSLIHVYNLCIFSVLTLFIFFLIFLHPAHLFSLVYNYLCVILPNFFNMLSSVSRGLFTVAINHSISINLNQLPIQFCYKLIYLLMFQERLRQY